jgi:hypothetical protein
MTKPSHFMFGLLVAFGATAALLGSRIVPETGRLPFESEAEAARKEARYAQRQRASGRMLDPGRGEFVAPRQDVLAGGPTQPAGVASTSGANPESGEQPSATSGPTEANVAPGWRLHGTVRLEDGSKNAARKSRGPSRSSWIPSARERTAPKVPRASTALRTAATASRACCPASTASARRRGLPRTRLPARIPPPRPCRSRWTSTSRA